MTGEVFPSLDMAVKAAVMGQGITMGDLVLIKEELETGKLVCPLADFSLRSEDDGMCLYGQGGCWDDPRSAAFKAWLMEMASKDRAPYNPSGG
jgi:LysR family glycine cleavage system transcriptional activator